MKLACDRGGEGERLLVLLHGLGATRQVWQPLLATAPTRGQGSWIAPDLRGHGASPHAASYALGHHAADVAELVLQSGTWKEIVILGHSMGGAVGLALASGWFGIEPACVFGLGIKVAWTNEELAQLAKAAAAPARWFDCKDEAIARYLRVSGLSGVVAPVSQGAEAGVIQLEQGWRLAADPATASVGPPPMRALLAAAVSPVHLARGETDRLVAIWQLRDFDSEATDIAGAGHNAMVEKPGAVWDWIERRLAS